MDHVTLTPVVRWAQNGPQIDVTIDLSDVSNPSIDISETKLNFKGFGHGAQGEDTYSVEIEFFSKIDYKASSYTITGRNVTFKIAKQVKEEEWPRLLKNRPKPAWLKVDFDKWQIEDSYDEKENGYGGYGEDAGEINKITFEERVKSEVEKAKQDLVIYSKVAWLSTYYLFQIICYAIIFGELTSGLYLHGKDVTKHAYDDVAGLLLSSHILAVAEIIHPLVGINKVALRAPLVHICVRYFILFILIVPVKELHETYILFTLLFVLSVNEIIRYPHNLLSLHQIHSWILAWIRYSFWIILYPIIFFCGGIIIFHSISLSSEMHRWEYLLPNVLNISFDLSSFLKIFIIIYCPGCVYFLKHMWKLRQRKVGRMVKAKAKQL